MKRTLVLVALGALVVLAAAAGRAVWSGRDALAAGDAAAQKGDTPAAITHYRRAARWHVPLAGTSGDALSRLATLAAAAETRGDVATAQAAWGAVRSATLSLRGLTAPHDDLRRRADARLAVLLATADNPSAGATADARAAYHRELLASSPRPRRTLFFLGVLATLALLATAAAVLARRSQRVGEADPRYNVS